jgi:ribosome-associated protein
MNAEQGKTEKFAIEVARQAAGARCEDVVIMDLRGLSTIADYFVVCTGTSERQMRAAADELTTYGRRHKEAPFSTTGTDTASWILVDFIHVVVHIFTREHRSYYDLELLWGDAPRIEWQEGASLTD